MRKKPKTEQVDYLREFLTRTPPRLVVPIHWDDLFSYAEASAGFYKLKPQGAITNTLAKTQKSMDLICRTAVQEPQLEMAIFQYGVAYDASVSTIPELNISCPD